jgi:hypothetical protein
MGQGTGSGTDGTSLLKEMSPCPDVLRAVLSTIAKGVFWG